MSLTGKYALVTGASRGIGRAIAVRLATMGYRVIVNYLSNTSAAEETLAQIRQVGGEGELLPFDVADRDWSSGQRLTPMLLSRCWSTTPESVAMGC